MTITAPTTPTFHDVQFPQDISYGSKGGPGFNTTILTLASGFEKRNVNWTKLRSKFDVSYGIKTYEQMQACGAFFIARQGKAYSFRFKDFLDFQITNQLLFTGDGATTQCFAYKTYASGGYGYNRQVSKIVAGTLLMSVGGTPLTTNQYTVDLASGLITLVMPPAASAAVTIDYAEFDNHVRFDIDEMDAQHDQWELASWASIPMVELKEKFGNTFPATGNPIPYVSA